MKKIIFLVAMVTFHLQATAQYNVYSYGQYGQKTKAATTQQNYNGGTDVYTYGQYGQKTKSRTYQKNYSGGYDVYEYGEYGQKIKVGTVNKKPY